MKMMKKIKLIMLLGSLLILSGCGLSALQTVSLGSALYGLGVESERHYENEK